jgi:pimeloyl-ACP methyl ester carboxylesterase
MIAVITIRGFTEDDSERTGTDDLFWDVIRKFAGREVTTIHPINWNANMDHLVSTLERYSIDKVIMVSYSWGAGYGAMKLAKKLKKTKINIISMLLCDPVYRPTWVPAWMGVLPFIPALNPLRKIRVPANVAKVRWVRQFISLPQAHNLLGINIHDPLVLNYSHTAIDSSREWRHLVNDELSKHIHQHE